MTEEQIRAWALLAAATICAAEVTTGVSVNEFKMYNTAIDCANFIRSGHTP